MPSQDVGFTVQGLDKAIRRLEKLGDQAVHSAPLMDEIGRDFIREEQARWGKGWRRNAPGTVRRKGNSQVGVDSGELEKSFTQRGHKWNIFTVRNGFLEFGSKAPHAHLFDRGRKGQPARKAIRMRVGFREGIARKVLDWIVRQP